MGKAIVSTTVGSEGFDVLSGQELVVADTPEEFAQAVVDLLRDPHRRQQMGSVAREFAGSGYDWPIVVPMLERVYEGS
jgi:glycosyltransferase involved in cell wall biosynthesis